MAEWLARIGLVVEMPVVNCEFLTPTKISRCFRESETLSFLLNTGCSNSGTVSKAPVNATRRPTQLH